MQQQARIYIAGHRGLVGSAILRHLVAGDYSNLIARTHAELDLERQADVEAFFRAERPEYVFLAAARVGGIWANNIYPAEFLYSNLAIQTHVLHAAWEFGVKRLLFLGSSCVYPRDCQQPMREEYLLTGPLEATNRPYAVAKIAGIIGCEAYNREHGTRFLAVMPTNLYGPNDNFDLETSHVLPALIRKFHLAKLAARGEWDAVARDEARFGPIPPDLRASLGLPPDSPPSPHPRASSSDPVPRFRGHDCPLPTASAPLRTPNSELRTPAIPLWGTGGVRREFLHVDDLATACVFLMSLPDDQFDFLLFPDAERRTSNAPSLSPSALVARDETSSGLPSALRLGLEESLRVQDGRVGERRVGGAPCFFPLINIGSGEDLTVAALAELVRGIVFPEAEISFDASRPDGTPQKLLDVSRIRSLGWTHRMGLREGIARTCAWYVSQTSGTVPTATNKIRNN